MAEFINESPLRTDISQARRNASDVGLSIGMPEDLMTTALELIAKRHTLLTDPNTGLPRSEADLEPQAWEAKIVGE